MPAWSTGLLIVQGALNTVHCVEIFDARANFCQIQDIRLGHAILALLNKPFSMNNSTPCMIVIAGVCGAGKTTVLRELQTMLDSNLYACHDIDEAGHSDNAGEEWLATQTDRWLDIAHKNAKRGRSTVVSGILFPTMIESSKKFIAAPPH
ncbi:MAG: hypothetical protein AAFX78_18630 [Cyanobacteria bacterium J06638_20]